MTPAASEFEPRRSVVVVSEDPLYGELLRFGLSAHGYDGRVVKNGRTAQALIEEMKPDAVILDIFMAHLDGTKLLHRLSREASDAIPVLVLLNSDDRTTTVEILVAGAHEVLTKPVGFPTILENLERSWTGSPVPDRAARPPQPTERL